MMFALNAAMVLARRQPTILLSDAKAISNDLRKYKRNGSVLHYDNATHLHRVKAYKSAVSSATALAMNGCVTEEANQNLSPQQKISSSGISDLVILASLRFNGSDGIEC